MTLLSIAVVALAFAALASLAFRRPYLLAFFAIFPLGMTARVLSSLFIDVAGPLDSLQLFRPIGPGGATTFLVLADLCFLMPILLVFSPGNVRKLVEVDGRTVLRSRHWSRVKRNLALVILGTFVAALYIDMFRRGVIPLFSGIERWIYTSEYGGVFHAALVEYGTILAFGIGLFFSVPWLRSGMPDRRFLALLMVLFGYLVLAGNRYSAFHNQGTAFIMPAGLVLLARQVALSRGTARTPLRKLSRLTMAINLGAVALGVGVVGFALYNSYAFTRTGAGDLVWVSFLHRVTVQPAEMWWATYERVFLEGGGRPIEAFDRLFVHTIVDPVRNSSIPYLMVAEIGSRAMAQLGLGLAWAGGFPEIAFELAGIGGGFLLLVVMGSGLAVTLYGVFYLAARERYVSTMLLFYVAYAFILFPLGGMLNFIVNWKYWVKVGVALAWISAESLALMRHGERVPHLGRIVTGPESEPV